MTIIPRAVRPIYPTMCYLPGSAHTALDTPCPPEWVPRFIHQSEYLGDQVIVQEKLDGVCGAVYRDKTGELYPVDKEGYPALFSSLETMRFFARWCALHYRPLSEFLAKGEWVVGEWLGQALGTRYDLSTRLAFSVFDVFNERGRVPYMEFARRCRSAGLSSAPLLNAPYFKPMLTAMAMDALRTYGFYGAKDPVEGAVWRIERDGETLAMAKFIRPDSTPYKYLKEFNGKEDTWNLPE